MNDNALYNESKNRFECPFCDHEGMIDDRFGIHIIGEHDEELVEFGRYGSNKPPTAEEIAETTGADVEKLRGAFEGIEVNNE